MLSLREKISRCEGRIGGLINRNHYLRRPCGHIYCGDSGYNALCLGDIAIARSEYLIAFPNAFSPVCECGDSLRTTDLQYPADSGDLRCIEDCWAYNPIPCRCCKDNVTAAGKTSRNCKHKHSREERGSASRDIKSHAGDGNNAPPAGNTGRGFNNLALRDFRLMECLNIVPCSEHSRLQLGRYKLLSSINLCCIRIKRSEIRTIKALCILIQSSIPALSDILYDCLNSLRH